jgi:hypothetical protein
MNFKALFFTTLLSTMLFSCSSNYYQLYKAVPTNDIVKQEQNILVFEDSNCKISYNLWETNGNIGFQIYNKTNENIYLNLEESFFVLNNVAHNYYKNRIVTDSSNQVASSSKAIGISSYSYYWFSPAIIKQNSSTVGYSVDMYEEKIVIVPSKTAKNISEYSINSKLLKNCSLLKYPSKKQIKAVSFSKSDTPLSFSNLISYRVGSGNISKIENAFYISEIVNYPEKEFFEIRKEQDCDKNNSHKFFKYAAPNMFYVRYSSDRGTDKSKY